MAALPVSFLVEQISRILSVAGWQVTGQDTRGRRTELSVTRPRGDIAPSWPQHLFASLGQIITPMGWTMAATCVDPTELTATLVYEQPAKPEV